MPLQIALGDKVQLKKKHPCGGDIFTLQRVGSDCRALCDKCGAQIWMSRHDFEKRVKKITQKEAAPDAKNEEMQE